MSEPRYSEHLLIRLDKELKDKLRRVAHEMGLNMSALARMILLKGLKSNDD